MITELPVASCTSHGPTENSHHQLRPCSDSDSLGICLMGYAVRFLGQMDS